jgi:hypothetical protein
MKMLSSLLLTAITLTSISAVEAKDPPKKDPPKEYKSGVPWKEPVVVTPGDATHAPSDATVLFDGTSKDHFDNADKWTVEDGSLVSATGTIKSKESFGSCQVHVEFATPKVVEGDGQGRGNSGIYLMGIYEVQVLDSYENTTYFDGQCASIYKQYPPLVNACRKPGEWQTYDIIFNAPVFGEHGVVVKPAYLTVIQNGVIVQNHSELTGATFYHKPPEYKQHAERLPLEIQDHKNPVHFRNIWVRDIADAPAKEEATAVKIDVKVETKAEHKAEKKAEMKEEKKAEKSEKAVPAESK